MCIWQLLVHVAFCETGHYVVHKRVLRLPEHESLNQHCRNSRQLHAALLLQCTVVRSDRSHIKWFCLFKISLMCIVFTGVARSNAFSRFLEQEWCEVLG